MEGNKDPHSYSDSQKYLYLKTFGEPTSRSQPTVRRLQFSEAGTSAWSTPVEKSDSRENRIEQKGKYLSSFLHVLREKNLCEY